MVYQGTIIKFVKLTFYRVPDELQTVINDNIIYSLNGKSASNRQAERVAVFGHTLYHTLRSYMVIQYVWK